LVKSAYKLAYSLKNNTQSKPGSSTTGDNNITLWNLIWKEPVSNKIKIFGWRTACDNLATKKTNLKGSRKLMAYICVVCGCEDESSYHATVACTKSKALRQEMRKIWDIPNENSFKFIGFLFF
jgi:hypothetical protein